MALPGGLGEMGARRLRPTVSGPRRVHRVRRWTVTLLLLVGVAGWALHRAPPGAAQGPDPAPVYVVDISGTIDLGLAPYLARVLGEAERAGAAAVLVEIDTPGGRVDAVLQMRDSLLGSPLRTIAFVDSTALSAGALVALASEEIHLTPGGVMGAATPVVGGTGEVADDKTVSAIRSVFAATAEQRGRDPRVAAAMVDPGLEVEGVSEAGDLLTLTAEEARGVGYADGIVPTRQALLESVGLTDHPIVATSTTPAERLVRFVTSPTVASLLLLVGMLAVVADLASGGIGVGTGVGVALLGLFFWGHMFAGLAGWEDVALVALGIALLAVEVFVLPGLGIAGVLGLALLGAGAFLAMINRDLDFVSDADLWRAGTTVGVAVAGTVVGLVGFLVLLNRPGSRSRLVLTARLGSGEPITSRIDAGWLRWFGGSGAAAPASTPEPDLSDQLPTSLVGAVGSATTDLRPSGVASIRGTRVDVVTDGDYIRRGETIRVVADEGYRRVVRREDDSSVTVDTGDT